jgi:hypothetical protein
MSEKISHLALAEELSSARVSIDNTLLLLKSSLSTMRQRIDTAISELETHGEGASLSDLGSLHDQGSQIDKLADRFGNQRIHLEQAVSYIRLVSKTR